MFVFFSSITFLEFSNVTRVSLITDAIRDASQANSGIAREQDGSRKQKQLRAESREEAICFSCPFFSSYALVFFSPFLFKTKKQKYLDQQEIERGREREITLLLARNHDLPETLRRVIFLEIEKEEKKEALASSKERDSLFTRSLSLENTVASLFSLFFSLVSSPSLSFFLLSLSPPLFFFSFLFPLSPRPPSQVAVFLGKKDTRSFIAELKNHNYKEKKSLSQKERKIILLLFVVISKKKSKKNFVFLSLSKNSKQKKGIRFRLSSL